VTRTSEAAGALIQSIDLVPLVDLKFLIEFAATAAGTSIRRHQAALAASTRQRIKQTACQPLGSAKGLKLRDIIGGLRRTAARFAQLYSAGAYALSKEWGADKPIGMLSRRRAWLLLLTWLRQSAGINRGGNRDRTT
jgi:hypothetical protein